MQKTNLHIFLSNSEGASGDLILSFLIGFNSNILGLAELEARLAMRRGLLGVGLAYMQLEDFTVP